MFQARTALTELSFFGTPGVCLLTVMEDATGGRVSRRESPGNVKEAPEIRRIVSKTRTPDLLIFC